MILHSVIGTFLEAHLGQELYDEAMALINNSKTKTNSRFYAHYDSIIFI